MAQYLASIAYFSAISDSLELSHLDSSIGLQILLWEDEQSHTVVQRSPEIQMKSLLTPEEAECRTTRITLQDMLGKLAGLESLHSIEYPGSTNGSTMTRHETAIYKRLFLLPSNTQLRSRRLLANPYWSYICDKSSLKSMLWFRTTGKADAFAWSVDSPGILTVIPLQFIVPSSI